MAEAPLSLALWGMAGRLAMPLAPYLLKRRLKRGKEHPERWREKLGQASADRPGGPLVWVHAASVGETNSVIPLIRHLHGEGLAILITTGTATSAAVAGEKLSGIACHQFAPLDTPAVARRFLDHWRPDAAIFVESEIWPTLLRALHHRDVPVSIINGSLSERSLAGWRRVPALAAAVLGLPRRILAQTEGDAARFRALGAPSVQVTGNVKFDVPPPEADPAALARLSVALSGRPVWIAASTHEGEETIAASAHRSLLARRADTLLLLAPRHPGRGVVIAAQLRDMGLTAALRSAGGAITPDTQVYVADTLGELGLFYRLAPVALVGGTFGTMGGHNPIEPVQLGCAVLHGPSFPDFLDIFGLLDAAGGAITVGDADTLAAAVGGLLTDPARRHAVAEAGRTVVTASSGALARTLAALAPDLDPLRAAARRPG